MNTEILAPLMFVSVLIVMFSGYPVAFALGGVAVVFGLIGVALELFPLGFLELFPQRIFTVMSNYVLLAVPFFVLMGTVLEKSKIAENLLLTIGGLFGRFRGGLAIAVVLVGTLLAAATGVVGASVVAMGMISMPVMLQNGYSPKFTSGVISASGTLGQIIPPSVVLVVLADQLGVSVGDMFWAALLPGLCLAGCYLLYVLAVAFFFPTVAPALSKEQQNSVTFVKIVTVLIPPLLLIILVLGSIFMGIATPTEAGALGAIGAMVLATISSQLDMQKLFDALDETVKLTSMVVFLLVGSTAFTMVFRGLYGDIWIEDILTQLPGGKIGLLFSSQLLIFALGFFIDFFEIAFILLPLLVPACKVLGIDLIWFGVLTALNLQTSFLTPPFGFSLFYLRGVAPKEVKTSDIYKGVVPFIVIQLLVLFLVALFPQLLLR
jgi:tripartite ATP-independent transporter DctM subunit